MHARRVQRRAEAGERGAKKGSPAPRIRTGVAPVRRRARRSQKLTARTRSSSSPPTSRLVSFDRRRPPAKLRKGLWRAKIFSARQTSGSDSSYVIDEHCTRPQTPKTPNAPTCAAEGLVLVHGTSCQVGSFSGGGGEQRRARGPWGCVRERLAQARAKRSRGYRAGRGGLRGHLGQERPSIVDLGPEIRKTWAEKNWHRASSHTPSTPPKR